MITVFDHALTQPWTVDKTYRRSAKKQPNWSTISCLEGSTYVTIGTLALYRGLCYALLGDGRLKPFPTGFTSINYRGIAGTWVPYVTAIRRSERR